MILGYGKNAHNKPLNAGVKYNKETFENMESQGITNLDAFLEVHRTAWILSNCFFWSGAALLSFYVKKVNGFTYLETLRAAAGLKRFNRNWKINLGQLLVLIIPLGIMAFSINSSNI